MSRFHVKINRRRWRSIRLKVFNRDGYRCCNCGKAGRLECDHILPLEKGGDMWDIHNLQTLCRNCHIEKTALENRKPQSPQVKKWRAFVDELR